MTNHSSTQGQALSFKKGQDMFAQLGSLGSLWKAWIAPEAILFKLTVLSAGTDVFEGRRGGIRIWGNSQADSRSLYQEIHRPGEDRDIQTGASHHPAPVDSMRRGEHAALAAGGG